MFDGGLDDALPGRRGFDGDAARQESGIACQRCPVGGGLFGGSAYLGGLIGVKVSAARRCEPDIDRLPYTDDQRVSLRRQLHPGLCDRVRGEFGSVIGEQHGPDSGGDVTVIQSWSD